MKVHRLAPQRDDSLSSRTASEDSEFGRGYLPTVPRTRLRAAVFSSRSHAAYEAGAGQADAGATDTVGHSCMLGNEWRVEADHTICPDQVDHLPSS